LNRLNLAIGVLMDLKKTIISAILATLICGYSGLAQEEEISVEDGEVIEMMEILDNFETLQVDMDLLEFLTEVGDEYDE
jgi:hypothetical protein